MPNISYIIATYEGTDHTSNGPYSSIVLHTQIMELCKYLSNNVNHCIHEVIIVKPKVRHTGYKNYYRFMEWKEKLAKYNVLLKILPYIGENNHHSYDQWIQGALVSTGDYYLLMEDDYCFNSILPNIDTELIRIYQSYFPNNIGYLCQGAWKDEIHGHHAAISNGLMSRDTIQLIPNILDAFYSVNEETFPQLQFSYLFLSHNIPITDYRKTFGSLFWNSKNNIICDYSLIPAPRHPIIPVQLLLFLNIT